MKPGIEGEHTVFKGRLPLIVLGVTKAAWDKEINCPLFRHSHYRQIFLYVVSGYP
jgi:hypothetical protein